MKIKLLKAVALVLVFNCSVFAADQETMGRPEKLPQGVTVTADAVVFTAAKAGDSAVIASLIKAKTDFNVKTDDKQQVTPLMLSAKAGKFDTLKLLVENGADVNTQSRFGFTALMFAAQSGKAKSVKYLIDKGADVNTVGHMWASALSWAKDKKIQDMLIKAGAK